MRRLLAAAAIGVLSSTSAFAQASGRFYAGATLGSNIVTADPIDTSAVSAAGGSFGVRLTPALSVELDVDRGFGELSRTYEGIGGRRHLPSPGAAALQARRHAVQQGQTAGGRAQGLRPALPAATPDDLVLAVVGAR